MEIRVLKYFLAVAAEGNITKAAQRLHLSQPTLSRQLIQMEEELGTQLFIRSRRSIALTEAGLLLKRRAEEIVSLSEKTELEISGMDQEIKGEIVIACGILAATDTMAKYCDLFTGQYPDVRFVFHSETSDNIVEMLEHGTADIGIVMQVRNTEHLNVLRLPQKERWGLLVRNDSPLAEKKSITPSDLINLPIIGTARKETLKLIRNWCGDQIYNSLQFTAYGNLPSADAILVSNGIGNAIVIEGSVQHIDLPFIPFSPSLTSDAMFVWKKNTAITHTTARFLSFLQKQIHENDTDRHL